MCFYEKVHSSASFGCCVATLQSLKTFYISVVTLYVNINDELHMSLHVLSLL